MLHLKEVMETPKRLNETAGAVFLLSLATFVVCLATFLVVMVRNAR